LLALLWGWALQGIASPLAYVGSVRCTACHTEEAQLWQGSHHDLAMAAPTQSTVLGNFDDAEFTAHGVTSRFFRRDGGWWVRTDGPDGALHDYPIRYTFGWYPLQQYLIEFPGGRLQALGIAWDSRTAAEGGQRWFHLYPDGPMDTADPLHWTGREQTWNYQCAECHSTGLKKGYDPASDSYHTAWAEIDVACESCHGPGSAHLAWAEGAPPRAADDGLAVHLDGKEKADWSIDPASGLPHRSKPRSSDTELDVCGRCHARRGQIWDDYLPGTSFADTHRLALLDDPLYFADGQIREEDYEIGSFLQSGMHQAGVTCSDCHEPHALKLRAEGDAVCTRCHTPVKYGDGSHSHHSQSVGTTCVSCHMPKRTYMGVDRRVDHSLRIPRPDLSVRLGVPNPCNQCHADKDRQWAADQVLGWRGGVAPLPHYGEAIQAGRAGGAEAATALTALIGDNRQPAIVRATAIDLLTPLAKSEQLLTIKRRLGDPDPLVRAAAVRYFAGIEGGRDALWPLLDDPVRTVRLEAAALLAPLADSAPSRYRTSLERGLQEDIRSLQVTAERPESHYDLGLLYTALGKSDEAEKAYRTALRLDARFSPAYINLADLYRLGGRESEGEAVLRAGVEHLPKAAELHHALGLALVRKGDGEQALAELAQAVELAPDNSRYGYVYAVALQGVGKTAEAVERLRGLLQRTPKDPSLLAALAQFSIESGDRRGALEYAERLLTIVPDAPEAKGLLEAAQAMPAK